MTLAIQKLNPDFVLSVDYPLTAGSNTPTNQGKISFKRLITTLHANGFSTQVRSGTSASNLLVFVKLSSFKYSEEAEKDLIKNYEFGVTSRNHSLADKLRITYQYLTSPTKVGGLGITPKQGDWDFVHHIVPVTDSFDTTSLVDDVKTHVATGKLTTKNIKEKYGVQVALYFEFLKFYITWLLFLTIFGLFSYVKSKKTFLMTYTFVNLIWGVAFLSYWNRRQLFLVNLWGVQNCHLVEEHNTELSQVNQNYEVKSTYIHKDNTEGKRFVRQLFFIPVALGFTGVLVLYQLTCFVLEIFLSEIYDGPGKVVLTLLPTIMISVFVPILTIIYNLVTGFVINWEGHDNSYSRNNSVLIKTYVLNFLTSYMPLIITSFIYLPFAHLIEPRLHDIQQGISSRVGLNRFYYKYLIQLKKQEDFKINQGRLNAQFFYFIVTNQVIQLILKYVLPIVISKATAAVKSFLNKEAPYEPKDIESEKAWLNNVRKTFELPDYNVDNDFRGLVLQYGYLIMFGPVWPLAPLVAIIFNLITFKLDSLKFSGVGYFKPGVPSRVDSIHPWNYALLILTWVGSVISPIITAFYRHGTAPPKTLGQFAFDKASVHISSSNALIFILFASEHGFFLLYYVLNKFSSLFKSEVEWANDFVDNDIKLRRDYYSGKVKPHFNPRSDVNWESFAAEDSIAQASSIVAGKAPTPATATFDEIPSSSKGYLTSANAFYDETANLQEQRRLLEEKTKLLMKKQEELSKASLNAQKDATDKIIETPNPSGGKKFSTIDDNKHFDAPAKEEQKPADEESTKDSNSDSIVDANDSQSESVVDSTRSSFVENAKQTARDITSKADEITNGKVTKKKTSLKKLFKTKK